MSNALTRTSTLSDPNPNTLPCPWALFVSYCIYDGSHVNDHILAGMQAFYTVHDRDNPDDDFSFFFGYSDDGT